MKSKPESTKLTRNLFGILILVLIFASSCTTRSYYLSFPNPLPGPDTITTIVSLTDSISNETYGNIKNLKFPNPLPGPDTIRQISANRIGNNIKNFSRLVTKFPNPLPGPDTIRLTLLKPDKENRINFYYVTESKFDVNSKIYGLILNDKGETIASTLNSKKDSINLFKSDSLIFVKASFIINSLSQTNIENYKVLLPVFNKNGQQYWLYSIWEN